MSLTRREFIKESAAGVGGVVVGAAALDAKPGLLPQRVLGRTKQRVSLVGFGLAPLGSDNTSFAEAERIVNGAIDLGITYLDVAPNYGNAEAKLKAVLAHRRAEVFLVTKVEPDRPTRAGVQTQIEEALRRMGTDRIDAVHIHNLGDWDMAQVLGPDGALAGLKEARKRGLIRFIGTSGHMRPARFARAIDSGDIDLTMNALNFADRHNYDFEGQVLPSARRHGTAVVAMKVLGGSKEWRYDGRTQANFAAFHERAIRYALRLPIACAVIGFNTVEEARQAVEVARRYRPLPAADRAALVEEGRRLAQARGLYYGPVEG
jgi:uncharacterized protein